MRLKDKYKRPAPQAAAVKGPTIAKGAFGQQNRFQAVKPKSASQIIKRLSFYLSGERKMFAASIVLILIHAGSALGASYMIRPLINSCVSGAGSYLSLALGLVEMAALHVASVVAFYLMSRIMLAISQRAQKKIRNNLFEKMQRLPIQFYDQNSTGDLMSRFANDVDTVGEMLNTTISQLLSGFVTLTGTLALMYYTSIMLALVATVFIPLSLLALKIVTEKGRDRYRRQQQALGALNGFIEESIAGQKTIKVLCHEDTTLDEFSYLNRDYRDKQVKSHSFGSLMMPLTQLVNNLTYSAVACAGVLLVLLRGFDIGGVTVFINYVRQFGRPLNELSGQMNTVYSALAGAERIFEVIDASPEQADPKGASVLEGCKGLLSFQNVSFGYESGTPVLRNISFDARKGEKTAFVGSTGAGKTTVANLIPRFYDIWEGAITIDGKDIRSFTRDSLRKQVTVILQDIRLFTGTIRENIRYGRLEATDDEVFEAAKTANAHEFISQLKDGYDTLLDKDGASLSQGQRQLLSIARAALSHAPILVMDEATSSVDARSERFIEEGLKRLYAERTTLVIAHRLSTVRDADTILVMEHGEAIERGSHTTLASLGGRYYELLIGKAELA
jgi:ATP-binding cassette subfamily B protein